MHRTAPLVACLAIVIGSVISYPVLLFEQKGGGASNKRVRSLKCENSGSSVRCLEETEQGMEESLLEVLVPSGGPYVIIEEAEIRTALEDAAEGIREKTAELKSGPYVMTQDNCPRGTVYVSEIDLCLEMKPPTTTTTPRPWSQVFVKCKDDEIYLSELDICVPADNCYPYPDCSQVPTTPPPKPPSRPSSVFDYGSRTSALYSPSSSDRDAITQVRIMDPLPAGSSTTRNEISFADLIKSTYDFKNNLV